VDAPAGTMARGESLRTRLYRQLEPRAWQRMGLSPVNAFLAVVVFACVLMAILETEDSLTRAWPLVFQGTEYLFTTIFVIEYLARVWVAPEDPRYRGLLGRLRYMVSIWALIDLVAILPALISGVGINTLFLRSLRLLRLIRLARLGAISDAANAMSVAVRERKYELILSAFVGVLMLLVSATTMYFVEGPVQPDKFGSIPRALWWAMATMTTVGYGDAFPISPLGKMLAGLFAISGIAIVALPTGILAAAFSDVLQTKRKARQAGGLTATDETPRP